MKFESKTPVPIDSLITNLGETAYVVSTEPLYFGKSMKVLSDKHPWIAQSHVRWLYVDHGSLFLQTWGLMVVNAASQTLSSSVSFGS